MEEPFEILDQMEIEKPFNQLEKHHLCKGIMHLHKAVEHFDKSGRATMAGDYIMPIADLISAAVTPIGKVQQLQVHHFPPRKVIKGE